MNRQHLQTVDLNELWETLLVAHLDAAMVKFIDLGLDVQAVHVSGPACQLRELFCRLSENTLDCTPAKTLGNAMRE